MSNIKTILISGGSDGLGKTIAAHLAKTHHVIILSPTEDKLRSVAEEIDCNYKVCNVSDYAQVEKVVAEVGKVDCLINNAGLWIQGPLDENEPARIQEVINVNTLGTINLTRAVVPGMKLQKSGLIINIISQAGLYGKAERSVYNASKWAITGFTKSIQPELAAFGIGVTGLYPGMLKTEMFAKMGIEKDMSKGLDTEDIAKTIEFLLSFGATTNFPEIGIKNLAN